jgi:hypothetical protein
MITGLKIFFIGFLMFGLSVQLIGQTSVSLKSQWLDPTNLFTEKKPTVEFNTNLNLGGCWSLNFYYAHDVRNLSPIYLISGFNYLSESKRIDSLSFASSQSRFFPKYSRNIFVSYQYSQTVRQLSWIQPIVTWNWNFIRSAAKTVHTFTAETSGWLSVQRGDKHQDGTFINGKYTYSKHLDKWIFSANVTTIAVGIFEDSRDIFVLGEVLRLSSTYRPFKTTLEMVFNKPLITPEDDRLGFTIGLTKEF